MADFVANQIVKAFHCQPRLSEIRILDPAVGDGELLVSLLTKLGSQASTNIHVQGFEIDDEAHRRASQRLTSLFPQIDVELVLGSFLDFSRDYFSYYEEGTLFANPLDGYNLVIANPPYVRTQILGTDQAKEIARHFGLTGRADLYQAFLACLSRVMKPNGLAGVITSNRFMTVRSGAAVRRLLREAFHIRHVWDLGDTRLFEAAVLPAVLLLEKRNDTSYSSRESFTSIYQTTDLPQDNAADPIEAVKRGGVVALPDGRRLLVQHGVLAQPETADDIWRIATSASDTWLATVKANTWGTFSSIGKIRVGIKTCADKIFIRSDWNEMAVPDRPELLRPLTTHHIARQFRPRLSDVPYQVLYPHECIEGIRRPVDLSRYPKSLRYLELHRGVLEDREYVRVAGRQWYEIWVPQDPAVWREPKLVFRDITKEPVFWLDLDGTVVNGDCYWLIGEAFNSADLLWLAAAVGNSSFIEVFYDRRFHNKLYAGRRRFITQYVEQFPLPNPSSSLSKTIITKAKDIYRVVGELSADILKAELDGLVWQAFGLTNQRS